jgi:hypothetical protein
MSKSMIVIMIMMLIVMMMRLMIDDDEIEMNNRCEVHHHFSRFSWIFFCSHKSDIASLFTIQIYN